jgi:multidrug transporter EmrE-like cation transporter
MGWVQLGAAVVAEVTATSALRAGQGLGTVGAVAAGGGFGEAVGATALLVIFMIVAGVLVVDVVGGATHA